MFACILIMNYQIVINAGGEGTRLQEVAKDLPKALVDIKGKPLILYAMDAFIKKGHKTFVFTTSYKTELIREYLGKNNFDAKFIYEKELAGRAGAIRLGIKQGILDPNKPTIIAHCDDIIDINIDELIKSHETSNCIITLVLSKSFVNPFGVAEIKDNRIVGFIEKPNYPTLSNHGIHTGMSIFRDLKLFENAVIPSHPENTIYPELARQNQINVFFVDKWFSVNTKEDYNKFLKSLG